MIGNKPFLRCVHRRPCLYSQTLLSERFTVIGSDPCHELHLTDTHRIWKSEHSPITFIILMSSLPLEKMVFSKLFILHWHMISGSFSPCLLASIPPHSSVTQPGAKKEQLQIEPATQADNKKAVPSQDLRPCRISSLPFTQHLACCLGYLHHTAHSTATDPEMLVSASSSSLCV